MRTRIELSRIRWGKKLWWTLKLWWLHSGRPRRLNTAARWMHQIGFADLASHSLRGRVLSLLLLLRRTQWFFVLWLMAFKSQFQKEPFDPHQSLHWNPYTLIYLLDTRSISPYFYFLTLRKFKTRSFKKKGSTCLRPLRFLLVMVHLLLMLAVFSLWVVYLLLHHNRLTPLLVAAGLYLHSNPVWFREKSQSSLNILDWSDRLL